MAAVFRRLIYRREPATYGVPYSFVPWTRDGKYISKNKTANSLRSVVEIKPKSQKEIYDVTLPPLAQISIYGVTLSLIPNAAIIQFTSPHRTTPLPSAYRIMYSTTRGKNNRESRHKPTDLD